MPIGAKGPGLRKERVQTSFIVVVCLLWGGCGDPGYRLRPMGWQVISDHKWTKQFGDYEIQTRGIRGLIGDGSVDPDLQIYNNTKPISVETGELITATEKFSAEVYSRDAIPPSTTGYHLPVGWRFEPNQAVPKVLGEGCHILLNLNVGGERRQIKIEYKK